MEPPAEYPRPSLKEIRGNGEKDRNLWWVRTDSGSITHTERWEKVWNPEWKLRIEQSVIDYLYKRKTGPKSRYSRKGVGRKPGGRAHQIRRASLFLLMHQDGEWWKERLTESDSSRHMKSVYTATVRMPDLSDAVDQYVRNIRRETGEHSHPAFKGSWRSQLSRMIEIRTNHEIRLKESRTHLSFPVEHSQAEKSGGEGGRFSDGAFDYRLFWP